MAEAHGTRFLPLIFHAVTFYFVAPETVHTHPYDGKWFLDEDIDSNARCQVLHYVQNVTFEGRSLGLPLAARLKKYTRNNFGSVCPHNATHGQHSVTLAKSLRDM